MMENMLFYNKLREVPQEALKPIPGGRLKGMSDINPMWRIKAITELFGPVGIGWYYEITNQWIEEGAKGEKKAFCNINLYYKYDGEWSMPIPGTGGSDFIANEKNGPYTSDECYKMALTDALSVAMKALGVAGNIYFEKDRTKYSSNAGRSEQPTERKVSTGQLIKIAADKGITEEQLLNKYNKETNLNATEAKFIKAEYKIKYYDQIAKM